MKYFICGFMGSGKSTVLKKLRANSDAYKYFDLDYEIHSNYGDSFDSREFIEAKGWDHFRRVETEMIESFLSCDEPLVIALGGGALEALTYRK